MRENQLLIRLSDREKRLLSQAATNAGVPLSTWARHLLLKNISEAKGHVKKNMQKKKQLPGDTNGGDLLSLFCGPGGLDLGFDWAGFKTSLAIDIDQECVNTFNANHPGQIAHKQDLRNLSAKALDELAGTQLKPVGIIGGPPCQSFSNSNVHQSEDDPRHELPMVYARILKELNSRNPISFFVFENVMGLLSKKHIDKYRAFKKEFEAAGFELFENRLDAKDYGVPQVRPRLIVVGINRKKHPECVWTIPEPTGNTPTVKDVIEGLPEPIYNSDKIDPSLNKVHPNHICMVPRSKKFLSGDMRPGTVKGRCFRVLDWDAPSWTVAYGNREVHVHPNGHRRLSMYEAMKFQTFPDWYVLTGNLTAQVRLVSEAVPPLLACHIADSVRASLLI